MDSEGFAHDHTEWFADLKKAREELVQREAASRTSADFHETVVRQLVTRIDDLRKDLKAAKKAHEQNRRSYESRFGG